MNLVDKNVEDKNKFTGNQIKFLIIMGLVMGLRELSMTMLNPFINIYGNTLKWSTPLLCGLALGIYGFTNAIFQIPYGSLSDRVGRKPVILLGLAQLAAGMFLAFLADNIYLLIAGRALQGSGAVMAIAYAWLGDGIEDCKKSRAMGIAGVIVALGAVIAFVLGPLLYNLISVRLMFFSCGIILLTAFVLVAVFIKEKRPEAGCNKDATPKNNIKFLLTQKTVILLSICGFIINYLNSEMFMIVPQEIRKSIGTANMWMVFLPAIAAGIGFMKVSSKLSDKGQFTNVSMAGFSIMFVGWIVLSFGGLAFITVGTILSLSGFMSLTAGIPSQMNKLIEKESRGAANGILQTMTFLGFFFGPTLAGIFMQLHLNSLIYCVPAIGALIGVLSIRMIAFELLDHMVKE